MKKVVTIGKALAEGKRVSAVEYNMFNPNGQNNSLQYSAGSVNEVIKQLAAKAGIKKKVNTHLIGHCYATHMVEKKVDINLIQKFLGHSNVKTTNMYLHISNNLISGAYSPIEDIEF